MARCLGLASFLLLGACAQLTSTSAGAESFTHPAGTLTGEVVWHPGVHSVTGTQTISGGSLTVPAGSTLQMAKGASIIVGKNAALQLLGTAAARVTVTSAATAPNRGDWGVIDFQEGSFATNAIVNADISYGGTNLSGTFGEVGMVTVEAGASVAISGSTVENSVAYGVAMTGDATLVNFSGNSLVHNQLGPVLLTANDAGQLMAGTYAPNDVDGIHVVTSTVSQAVTWQQLGTPYLLQAVNIETLTGQATLTVAPGATLMMAKGQSLLVGKNGGLYLAGTAAQPITVTSQANPANPGDWGSIEFAADSLATTNALVNASISYGGGGSYGGPGGSVALDAGASATIQDTTVTDSASVGIAVTKGGVLAGFSGNTLMNNIGSPISIDVDSVSQLNQHANTYSAGGIEVVGSQLLTSATWGNLGAPYVITQSFYVDSTAPSGFTTLTLAAGTTLQLAQSVGISIQLHGQLVTQGTPAARVSLTAVNELQPWGELLVLSSGTSSLASTTLSYGGNAGAGQLFLHTGAVTVSDLQLAARASISPCDYSVCSSTVSGTLPGTSCQNPQC